MIRRATIVRPEVEHLFSVEHLARTTRRAITAAERPTPVDVRKAAAVLIERAISELVAARAEISVPADSEALS